MTFFISDNRMIFKVMGNKARSLYVLWWREYLPKWPAILNVKMPKKIYPLKGIGWSTNRVTGSRKAPSEENMEKVGFLFKTDSEVELVAYLCANEYPQEFINFFVSKW